MAQSLKKEDPGKSGDELVLEKALLLCEQASWGSARQALADLGSPPARPSEQHQGMSASLGKALAQHGQLDEMMDLINKGWAQALFPARRWEDYFDSMAALGAKGYACLDALDAAGVKFFGGVGSLDRGASPLCSAARRLDGEALDYFLSKMDRQQASASRALFERGRLAALALPDLARREHLAPMIKAHPKDWAQSLDDRGGGALRASLENGLLDLAEAMLAAAPEAIKLADPTRCAFSSDPLKTLALLVKHGVNLSLRGSRGLCALHAAMYAGAHSESLAATLISLGADPRSRDENGTTPIGAAMARWTWSDMQQKLGATPEDLMDSGSQSSMHGVGLQPTLINALGQVKFSDKAKRGIVDNAADARMAEIVMAASADPRAQTVELIEAGMSACADHGLPQCLAAFVEIGARHGAALRAELLASAVEGLPMSAVQEAGRMSCLKLAESLGVNLNEPYPAQEWAGQEEATTLIEQALKGAVTNSGAGSNYFEPMARKARLLAELGCDPSGAKGAEEEVEWSFDVNGVGRGNLAKRARLEFLALDAILDDRLLQRSLDKESTKKNKNGRLRM